MKPRSTLLLCSAILLAGIVIGASLDSWPRTPTVQANGLNQEIADTLYRELGSSTNSLVAGSQLLAKIASLTTPSVVHIQSMHSSANRGLTEETGSGVFVSSSKAPGTFVVTNRHVVAGAPLDAISIHVHDGRVIHPTRIWTDKATDVAVMKVVGNDLHPARFGDSDQVKIGHMVLAMGSPFGLSRSMTFGIIGAKGRRSLRLGTGSSVLNQDFLQTDAAINPGNSGGPLIDLHGKVIGINTAIASNSGGNDGIGFSIPSNLVRWVVDQLLEHGKVRRAYLGVNLDLNFDVETAGRLKLDRARGARIVKVRPNTPASRVNLKFNDVILGFDGIDVLDKNHLINLVSLAPVGKRVKLVIQRNGRKLTVHVLLADRPELKE